MKYSARGASALNYWTFSLAPITLFLYNDNQNICQYNKRDHYLLLNMSEGIFLSLHEIGIFFKVDSSF